MIKNNRNFVSLLSTGLDSPIATYIFLKRGFNCNAISFINSRKENQMNREKIIKTANRLKKLTQNEISIHLIYFEKVLNYFRKNCKDKIRCLLCKRTMINFAQDLAQKSNSECIIMGDILGEQASQTIDNLLVVNKKSRYIPIIRPLIGFNKLDIIKMSQDLGFYEISLMKEQSCNFNPKYPETRAKVKEILAEESKLEKEKVFRIMQKNCEILKID